MVVGDASVSVNPKDITRGFAPFPTIVVGIVKTGMMDIITSR